MGNWRSIVTLYYQHPTSSLHVEEDNFASLNFNHTSDDMPRCRKWESFLLIEFHRSSSSLARTLDLDVQFQFFCRAEIPTSRPALSVATSVSLFVFVGWFLAGDAWCLTCNRPIHCTLWKVAVRKSMSNSIHQLYSTWTRLSPVSVEFSVSTFFVKSKTWRFTSRLVKIRKSRTHNSQSF